MTKQKPLTTSGLACPQINNNGTAPSVLMMEIMTALDAIAKAELAIAQMTVHGRDFPANEFGEFLMGMALGQKNERMRVLDELHKGLSQYAAQVSANITAFEEA